MAKRANGEGNIKKRKDGSWEARLIIGDKRRSVYGKTQAEVVQKLRNLKTARDVGLDLDSAKMTLAEWLDIWMREYRNSIKESTKATYAKTLRRYIIPNIGNIKLSKLSGLNVQKLYNAAVQNGLSPKTVKNIHGILHKALEQALRLGYVERNVCDSCELPTVYKKEMHPLSGDALEQFISAIQSDAYGDLMFIALFTGMRESELIGLTWDCVDFARKEIRVYRQLSKPWGSGVEGEYIFTCPKNNKERTFTAIDSVFDALHNIKAKQTIWQALNDESWSNSEGFVFTNEIGQHYATQTVYKHFKKIARKIGADNSRFHDLRHTYATLAIAAGVDIKTISESLGHATVAFTMDVYGHTNDRSKRDNAIKLQNYVSDII